MMTQSIHRLLAVNWKELKACQVKSPLNTPDTSWSTLHGKSSVVYIFYFIEWTAEGGGVCRILNWNFNLWNERALMKVVRWNRSLANIWSNFGLQLPWITSSPPVKGDHPVWSNTGCTRHGAVVFRIVNWKGLKKCHVRSPLNIWIKFGVWLPRTLRGPRSTGESSVVSIFILLRGPEGGRGYVEL